jgi:hypothetical protein
MCLFQRGNRLGVLFGFQQQLAQVLLGPGIAGELAEDLDRLSFLPGLFIQTCQFQKRTAVDAAQFGRLPEIGRGFRQFALTRQRPPQPQLSAAR